MSHTNIIVSIPNDLIDKMPWAKEALGRRAMLAHAKVTRIDHIDQIAWCVVKAYYKQNPWGPGGRDDEITGTETA